MQEGYKLEGREVHTKVPSVMAPFLHNGERLLVTHIPTTVSQIYNLARI